MIIATTTLIIVQIVAVGCVLWLSPEPCPRKYRVTQEQGGVLANMTDIHRYCELDYGGKFVLKEEFIEEIIDAQQRLKD